VPDQGRHLKLADFYKGEAVRLEAEAKDHDEMAGDVSKKPNSDGRKTSEAFVKATAKEIARRYRVCAKTQELAAMHEHWRQR